MRIREKCLVKRDGKTYTLCDLGVYTKNRNFRIYYSSKCGKKIKLRWAEYDQFYASRRPTHEEIFYDSMVVPLDYDTMPARVDVALIREREALIRRLNAKHFYDGVRAMKNEGEYEGVLVGEMAIPQAKSASSSLFEQNVYGETYRGAISCFPLVDQYVLDRVRWQSPNALIREWQLCYRVKTASLRMRYKFFNNRFCYNINREHKSNNVYWTVDFNYWTCAQQCLDPDCRAFCSQRYELDDEVKSHVRRSFDQAFKTYLPTAFPLYEVARQKTKDDWFEIILPEKPSTQ